MTNTSYNPVVIIKGGVTTRLDTMAYNVGLRTAGGSAAMRGEVVKVPGRSGSIYLPGRQRDDGVMILEMWVSDDNTDGAQQSDRYLTWRSNLDTLMRLFDTRYGQITVREYLTKLTAPSDSLPSTGYREATCEVRAAIDPELFGWAYGALKVELVINDTYWRDYQDLTFTSTQGTGAVATHTMSNWAGATAPTEDCAFIVDGPITDPKVTDVISGHWVQYTGTLASGTQWVVDSSAWASVTGSGIEWTYSSGTSVTANTVAQGLYSPRLYAVSPWASGPTVKLDGTGAGANTRLRIKGRRKFH
jgi:hypothetical protein